MNIPTPATTDSRINIIALDGVRALAVLLVMAVHYHERFGGGWVGVQIFFVLSGFLITRILVNAKETASGLTSYLKVFWIRRALRIFPLYVLFLLIGELMWWFTAAPVTWPTARPWLWTYTLNFGHMFGMVPISDVYSHFWSLAVEEQFYVLWPFLIWFLGRKTLRYLIIAMLLITPILRYAVVAANVLDTSQLYFFTPTLMDAFAAGAALVLFDLSWIKQVRWWLAGAVLTTVAAGMLANLGMGLHFSVWSLGYPYFMPNAFEYVWGYTMLNVTSALLLLACIQDQVGLFANRYVAGLGKISYGVYIVHRPMYRIVVALQSNLATHLRPSVASLVSVVVFLVGSITLAWISFWFFENPLLKLKRYFSYRNAQGAG